jgi:hypothetical protein
MRAVASRGSGGADTREAQAQGAALASVIEGQPPRRRLAPKAAGRQRSQRQRISWQSGFASGGLGELLPLLHLPLPLQQHCMTAAACWAGVVDWVLPQLGC